MAWTYLLVAALTLWEGNLEIVPIHRSWDKQLWPSSVDGFESVCDNEVGEVPLTCLVAILGKNDPCTMVVASGRRKQ